MVGCEDLQSEEVIYTNEVDEVDSESVCDGFCHNDGSGGAVAPSESGAKRHMRQK